MERRGVRERVCVLWNCLLGWGQLQRPSADFAMNGINRKPPSPNAIRRWVRQWREEGSVTCKKPPGWPSSVCTPDNIVRETLQSVMRSFLTRVHLCIEEGGGQIKDIVHKE